MQVQVTGGNQILYFIGWEGVEIVSYQLINNWSTIISANKGAIKAQIINRVGDQGQTGGIIIIKIVMGEVSYEMIGSIPRNMSSELIEGIGIQIQIGVRAKSAQMGLHTWLGTAMEGPTPVSAQMHAATMATAGVYVVIRLSRKQE